MRNLLEDLESERVNEASGRESFPVTDAPPWTLGASGRAIALGAVPWGTFRFHAMSSMGCGRGVGLRTSRSGSIVFSRRSQKRSGGTRPAPPKWHFRAAQLATSGDVLGWTKVHHMALCTEPHVVSQAPANVVGILIDHSQSSPKPKS